MQTVMEVEQLATVMGMVRAGVGISVVPALTLFHFRDPAIATLLLDLPGLRREIYLVTRRDRSLSLAATRLREQVNRCWLQGPRVRPAARGHATRRDHPSVPPDRAIRTKAWRGSLLGDLRDSGRSRLQCSARKAYAPFVD